MNAEHGEASDTVFKSTSDQFDQILAKLIRTDKKIEHASGSRADYTPEQRRILGKQLLEIARTAELSAQRVIDGAAYNLDSLELSEATET